MSNNRRSNRHKKVTPSNGTSNQSANLVASIDTPYKTRSAQQYEIYRRVDPFPDVEPALLNYVDAYRYIYTCGIIDEFHEEKLKGITYSCSFSGNAYFCKTGEKEMKLLEPDKDGYYIIASNSITYLEIAETIRVPEYLALRFNLSVSNAYKGLLLGTGPIVDPGFVGKLYIPLHNLTANEYKIKKEAELILIEFTKQSRNDKWTSAIAPADVSSLTIQTKKIEPLRTFKDYITKALTGKNDFRNRYDTNYVCSSIPEAIREAKDLASDANDVAFDAIGSVVRMKTKITIGGFLAVIGVILTVFSLLIPTWQAFNSFNKERSEYQSTIIQYQETIKELEQRLISLEIDDKQEKLDTLQKQLNVLSAKYTTTEDKNSDVTISLNEQIAYTKEQIEKLEKEIADLQK
nr:hypothetical protein [Sedimentibacter sp.]